MKILKLLTLSLLSINVLANSAMIFPQRAILDSQNRTANFKVVNPTDKKVEYKISLQDRVQEENGKTKEVEEYKNSSKNNLIFSPRKSIKLPANGKKPIRIKLSKYAELPDGEHRTYLKIITNNKKPENQEGYYVALRTGIQLPIIVRKGNLKAEAKIGKVSYNNNKLSITLHREGNRSIFGDLKAYQNEKLIGKTIGVAVYTENSQAEHSIDIKGHQLSKNITIKFIEDENSGDIEISKTTIL